MKNLHALNYKIVEHKENSHREGARSLAKRGSKFLIGGAEWDWTWTSYFAITALHSTRLCGQRVFAPSKCWLERHRRCCCARQPGPARALGRPESTDWFILCSWILIEHRDRFAVRQYDKGFPMVFWCDFGKILAKFRAIFFIRLFYTNFRGCGNGGLGASFRLCFGDQRWANWPRGHFLSSNVGTDTSPGRPKSGKYKKFQFWLTIFDPKNFGPKMSKLIFDQPFRAGSHVWSCDLPKLKCFHIKQIHPVEVFLFPVRVLISF